MNLCIRLSSLLFVTSMLLVSTIESHDKKHEKIKYIQGGACEGGNGSKNHPFSTLQDAEAADWDVLMVLSSSIALDGGITLKDGQKLIGEEDPTDIALSPTQPIITNIDSSKNAGNGVIVNGNATIEKIYFKDTYASAINYDNAKDLTVSNVLVTGHGQEDFNAAGMLGRCQNSGETSFIKVIIRDNGTSNATPGIFDEPSQGAHRALIICSSELTGIKGNGIVSIARNKGTTSSVLIRNLYIHDFINDDELVGILCESVDGAHQSVLVQDSLFTNIGSDDGAHISCSARQGDAHLTLKVAHCAFEETLATDIVAIEITNDDEAHSTEMAVENSVINCSSTDCIAFESTIRAGKQTLQLLNNKVTLGKDGTFYNARSREDLPGETDVKIKKNFFTGSRAIRIDAVEPWNKLNIEATHNCFQGDGSLPAFESAEGFAGKNATLHAHKNSISGFIPDIKESDDAGVFYDVTKNWWGHTNNVPCTPGPCEPFQTCIGVTCTGPIVDGTTNVDASDPLVASSL